ncbi:pyrimidine-nucleoside phosphorylase [Paenibacillus naphthalenovorans]|uniref:Pyrimidine-nucleoside phosphorylase n=1 Tax=Paenibacillus naphthalenovorans TaxID=162209 RepID=A0A0U2L027_9BACL|nr:pyrimidine-nucleoside phosphorylase [Paenibacillus naphthalenovorans]ALS22754.1 thymidine phosphorylase [Paenibacillus naphthalenovorans]SDH78745.1 pyrimidine-nucleoside phosphorylase [Paenibacillus naphthalenovorans]
MRTVDIIHKKRDGGELTKEELDFLIEGYTRGDIPDYQLSAWAMAVFFNGMTARETAELTMAMVRSGEQVDLSSIPGVKVDKHSTGGVGDTTTLILAPLVAAAGIPVAKMSGRGLGHTGGTIDKLEAIPGFEVERTKEQFLNQVKEIGLAVVGQSGNLTPADKKLYALRDVTATVESIPLIASSIMSKKIASGADAIVLDVKTGRGAFMKSLEDSVRLAKAMVEIGTEIGRETVAVITNMDEPLGPSIGNALEVREAIETLKGQGPAELTELCRELAKHMVLLGGKAQDETEAKQLVAQLLKSGEALEKLKQLIKAQGGDARVADEPDRLPEAAYRVPVPSPADGCIAAIDAEALGVTAMLLGAGRATKEDPIDLAVGIKLFKRVGDAVKAGEPLAELYMNRNEPADTARMCERTAAAFTITEAPAPRSKLIYAVVTRNGVRYL